MWLVVINVLGVSGWVWSLFVSDSIFVLVGGEFGLPKSRPFILLGAFSNSFALSFFAFFV